MLVEGLQFVGPVSHKLLLVALYQVLLLRYYRLQSFYLLEMLKIHAQLHLWLFGDVVVLESYFGW